MSETCEHGEKGWCMSCHMDLVDNKREMDITIDVLKKVVVKQAKKLRDLRAEHRTLVEAVRSVERNINHLGTLSIYGLGLLADLFALLPQDSEKDGE